MERTIILLEDPEGFPENMRAVVHLDDKAVKVGPRTYRKRILRYGKWSHKAAPDGVLAVDESYGKKLVNNFTGKVFDAVKAVKGHPKTEAEAIANAAGDVVALDDLGGADGPGVYATVTVPEDVSAEIDSGAIVGCSAGIIPSYADHELDGKGSVGPVLEHLAFTNTPYIKGLGGFSPVHLADSGDSVLLSLPNDKDDLEGTMTREELLAKAKELGIDIETLEADAGKVSGLEAELAEAKKPEKPEPTEATAKATKDAAVGEVVAALSDAFAGAELIELAEGETPTLKGLVDSIATGLAAGKATGEKLALSEAEADVDAAIKDGKALPAQRDSLIKVRLSDKETYEALIPEHPLVDLSEHGTAELADGTTLADGTKATDEVDRLVALAEEIDA